METLIQEKFKKNAHLQRKLESDPHTGFFELTSDKKWASGVRLTAGTKTISEKNLTGKNFVGLIIGKIKAELGEIGEPKDGTEINKTCGQSLEDPSRADNSVESSKPENSSGDTVTAADQPPPLE